MQLRLFKMQCAGIYGSVPVAVTFTSVPSACSCDLHLAYTTCCYDPLPVCLAVILFTSVPVAVTYLAKYLCLLL